MTQTKRLDIQGLRALAVVLVVIFHLAPAALPGGYIGVDIFFVISGFLITAHLLREVNTTGGIQIFNFWARRARRLLPAALLVLLVSAVFVLFFLPTSRREQNLIEIALAALYVVNWSLAANSVDYLGSDNSDSIAQHYWSLSVEEQFYIVWPLLLIFSIWLFRKIFRWKARRSIFLSVGSVLVLSFVFSMVDTARSQPSAYFVTGTRVWEFAVGALLAMIPNIPVNSIVRHFVSWSAIVCLGACSLSFGALTQFPGWVAAIPIVATGWLLWAGDDDSIWSPQFLSHAGPVQIVGDLSYSIYLWHWPLIVVFVSLWHREPGWKWMLIISGLTILLAALSKKFIEDPIRRTRSRLRQSKWTFSSMVTAMAVVVCITLTSVIYQHHLDEEFSAEIIADVANRTGCFGAYAISNHCDEPYIMTATVNPDVSRMENISAAFDRKNCSVDKIADAEERKCQYEYAKTDDHVMFLLGDSHAEHITATLAGFAREDGWDLYTSTRQGCIGFEPDNYGDQPSQGRCVDWGKEQIERLVADSSIDVVILAGRTGGKPTGTSDRAAEAIDLLKASGKIVVVVRDVPGAPNSVPPRTDAPGGPECVQLSNAKTDPCSWTPPPVDDWMMNLAEEHKVPIVDTWKLLCSADHVCHTVIGGTIVYADNNHLTVTFARTMIPWMRGELNEILSSAS